MRIALLLGLCLACTGFAKPLKDYKPLFDGKTLQGWQALPGGEWSVVDGAIVGKQDKTEKRHGQLISDTQYENFILRVTYKALKGNSGVYFRVQKVKHPVAVKGFQAEVDATGKDVGGLYETLGRAWVIKPSKENIAAAFKKNDWNNMTVVAMGGNITVVLNGTIMSQLTNDKGLKKGHIALQLHGNQDMDVQYKDLMIREYPSADYPTVPYTIHDRNHPVPPIVTPKPYAELADSAKLPAGATSLFDGTDTSAWATNWPVVDGVLQTGKDRCATKESFGDCKLHVEWRVTDATKSGNSGIFLMNQFEVQVFNSHNNGTPLYADGQAAAVYGQYPPLVNACRKPGEWEVYDIDFTAPKFQENRLLHPARMTVHHNGHLVHDNVELTGPTGHYARPLYRPSQTTGPIRLQHHGDTLQFRNIWVIKK